MAKYEWRRAYLKEAGIIDFGKGEASYAAGDLRRFLEEAGEKGKVFIRDKKVQLYYNSETGDIFIPEVYRETRVVEIKKAFLRFISRDDHEDVPYKVVEIEE